MEKPVVEVETTIEATPDEVWAAMTQKKSPMYMGATMDTDWKPGSKYTLKGEWNGKAFTDHGEIEKAEPGKELLYTHWSKTEKPPESYNAVRVHLAKSGKGTKATLEQYQRGKPQELDAKGKAEFKKNWAMMLEALKKDAEKA